MQAVVWCDLRPFSLSSLLRFHNRWNPAFNWRRSFVSSLFICLHSWEWWCTGVRPFSIIFPFIFKPARADPELLQATLGTLPQRDAQPAVRWHAKQALRYWDVLYGLVQLVQRLAGVSRDLLPTLFAREDDLNLLGKARLTHLDRVCVCVRSQGLVGDVSSRAGWRRSSAVEDDGSKIPPADHRGWRGDG